MPEDDRTRRRSTANDKDAEPPLAGRQSQRPGQHGRFQPRPGQRDADTMDSTEEEGFTGPPPARGELPSSQRPRRGSRPRRD